MSWTTYVAELRQKLSDGPTDRYKYRKKVFGTLDSTNLRFKTLEMRRVTDFTAVTTLPTGVFVNGIQVTVTSDTPEQGDFVLQFAPNNTDLLEATYYVQYFLDTELNQFVVNGVKWLGYGSNPVNLVDGLQPAALAYASYEAYKKLIQRNAEKLSEGFLLEDQPSVKRGEYIDPYKSLADSTYKEANTLRDDFYKRQGQPLAPLFGISHGRVGQVTPRR